MSNRVLELLISSIR